MSSQAWPRFAPWTFLCVLSGCSSGTAPSMSAGDAQAALEGSTVTAQADTLVSDTVEIGTHFDIGSGLENAAAQIQAAIQAELPCADITRDGSALTINYGANPGDCSYHGHQVTGEHWIRVMRNADNEVTVHHEWQGLSDGRLAIDGEADVSWSRTANRRHVLHDLSYQVVSGRDQGRTGTGSGDRTQTAIDGGVRVDGERIWDSADGHYVLDLEDVEMRFIDPVPQAGTYRLTTPSDEALTLVFRRIDTDSIRVMVESPVNSFAFVVNSDGSVTP